MKIKNIQQYRSFYKTEIRDSPTRDEHFIGNFLIDEKTGKKKFGWFEIYHGDKEGYGKAEAGIENFLQSFLDMAKDGQAVYEFLQNAVDAGSTHYTMIWGQDEIDKNYYLLVANNGKMFNLDSIRSILNVGSSTKTADSQTIGKFGIGFKLAHRLVGKDNGLHELINENSGPILFSWKNYEIEKLAVSDELIADEIVFKPSKNGSFVITDNNPWLFKILITCFPCLPDNDHVAELPKMANGIVADSNPFSKSEYEVLSRWVKNNQGILNKETYKEGALFFIKLGSGKESELAELNLKEGVKFALAILKETADGEAKKDKILHTVQLNGEEPITYPDLEYTKLTVDRESDKDTYAYVRFGVESYEDLTTEQKNKIAEEANIEALFGYRKHNEIGDYFKGAPNIYLYFPLSEEVHNFNYILHSNAFYKGSSRTFLHKGSSKEDGINERLLKTIVNKIDAELKRLSDSKNKKDRQQFLHFYAALLTSAKSTNQDRLWIEEPYINRINELLKKYIPVRKSLTDDEYTITDKPEHVFIRKTKVEIDTQAWDLDNVNWFYWGDEAEGKILLTAFSKLGVKDYTIHNLLSSNDNIVSHLNAWLNDDEEKIKTLLSEIALLDAESIKQATFKNNLFNSRLLKFSNEEVLSINQFQEKEKDGYFLVFNKLNDIKDLLHKLGLHYTKENFDNYNFNPKYFSFFANESQVRSYIILTKLFSQVVKDEKLNLLSKEEKHRIYEAFRTLNDTPGDRMGDLKLFKNNSNRHVCFKNLYAASNKGWLNKFCISNAEDSPDYKNYLLSEEEELYKGIIYPFWDQIAAYIAANQAKVKEVLDDIVAAYTKSKWQEKQKHLLHSRNLIIYQSQVIESEGIYFSTELELIPDDAYRSIQSTALKYFGVHIPDKYLLSYLDALPFSFTSVDIEPVVEDTTASMEEIGDLLLLSKTCELDFFSANCIIEKDGVYSIDSTSGKKQIATSKSPIVKYIDTYYPGQYVIIPESFSGYKSKIALADSALVEHLIEIFAETEQLNQELDLIEILIPERFEDKKAFLNKLTYTNLDATWTEERQNQLYIKLLSDVAAGNISSAELTEIQKKVSINTDDLQIFIGDVDSAHDSIEIFRGDKKIILSQSQILNLPDAESIKLIQSFHDEARKRDLINQSVADKIFKISNAGITDELVTKFRESLENNQVINAHQLLFIWLSGKIKKEEFGNYSLKSHDDKWYKIEGQLIIYTTENSSFIKPSFLLHEDYNGLQSLLQLNDLEAFNYNEAEDDIIASRFLFVKGSDANVLESADSIGDKLNFLFNGWKNLTQQLRLPKRKNDWAKYLGLIPNQYVLDGIHLKEEVLPDEILDWCQTDKKKKELLSAIGVFVGDSPIDRLRKYLTGKIKEQPQDIDIERFNETILLNTINGLAGEFEALNNQPVIYSENIQYSQLALIGKIINHLVEKEVEEYPALIYNTTDTFKVLRSQESSLYMIDDLLHLKLKQASDNSLNLLYSEYNVLKLSQLLNEKIVENCDELEFEKNFVPSGIQREHDEPFYHTWKSDNRIRLFREPEIRYDMSIEINSEMITIARISEGVFNVNEDIEGFKLVFYKESISLEELKEALFGEYEEISDAVDDLISRRNTLLTSIYNTLNSAGRSDVKNESLKAFESALKDENLKQERKDLIEKIKENTDYSYTWFEAYLKILLTYESKQSTTVQKSITFQEIRRYTINDQISDKYFLLCGASSLIPLNIEDFEDFKIILVIKDSQNEKIKVEGVSKKGQDLLIYCREKIPQSIIKKFSDIIQVKISFSPVIDLLERLYRAFTNRHNMDEWDDINETLPPLQFIYGPPGTGKTTTLCSMLADAVKENYNAKFLLLTPTNKAADVLCKKLVKPSDNPDDIIGKKIKELDEIGKSITITRVGKPTDPELEDLEEDIYQDSVTMERVDYTNILASTIHRIPYFEILDEEGDQIKIFRMEDYWDYIVFDEASMINLPYIVFAILALYKFNHNAKFIIAGDPKQIPPVVDVNDKDLEELDIQDENIYTMMGISSFRSTEQNLREGDIITNLDRQFRSVKQIGQLFSELSYSNLLKHDREEKKRNARPLPEGFRKLINKNVTFIDIPLDKENSIFRIDKLLYSSYHTYSAIFVAELIKYLDALIPDGESWSIGLIAPYKAQAILLNKLITSYGISEKLVIYSDTVHGFQGDECDMVFFVSNPNNYYYTGHPKCLLSKEYIYNVAISRAKDYLIILHPFEAIRENPYINSISASYSKNFENPLIRESGEFEKIMFNQKDFIERSSYITGHDNVNVFGQIEMKYFIKANESAIDIQLRKFNN